MTYTPKPGDRVLIPGHYGEPKENCVWLNNGTAIYVNHGSEFELEVLPDERPVDPQWWPPQPGDVAIAHGGLVLERGEDFWVNLSGYEYGDDDMRGADLIARGGKRWPPVSMQRNPGFDTDE